MVSGVPRDESAHLSVPEADRGRSKRPRHRWRADHRTCLRLPGCRLQPGTVWAQRSAHRHPDAGGLRRDNQVRVGRPGCGARDAARKALCIEEAARLGFFHEVVEPGELVATAISYARSITPDCNTAYALSKRALQDDVLRKIEERTLALDERLPAGISDPGNRRAQDRRRREIMHSVS